MENKKLICQLLLMTLQATRHFNDLVDLTYDDERELVIATFDNGHTKVANVACDSGKAMITDTIRQIS